MANEEALWFRGDQNHAVSDIEEYRSWMKWYTVDKVVHASQPLEFQLKYPVKTEPKESKVSFGIPDKVIGVVLQNYCLHSI
jgi:hypothetical protein